MKPVTNSKKQQILDLLKEVSDPEIPAISVVDLGIISDVRFADDNSVFVKMTPTFVGCPAIQFMQNQIREKIESAGYDKVIVEVDMETKWSTNNISEEGRKKLTHFGLAPPCKFQEDFNLQTLQSSSCPRCGSDDTVLRSPFGSTLCRAIHYCNNCNEVYEQFKPL